MNTDSIEKVFDYMKVENEILKVAGNKFESQVLQKFIEKFYSISSDSPILDYLVNLSTDEGDELEITFYTSNNITDITLSSGKIYSYSYPLDAITEIRIDDLGEKVVLIIQGEKKFDYNVVKPGSVSGLTNYKNSLENIFKDLKET